MREANLNQLNLLADDLEIYLGYKEMEYGVIKYSHWFVTDKTNFIEFGSVSLDIYKSRVTINSFPRDYSLTDSKTKMNEQIRSRIRHVLGMSNYSLCLRNCEHVANYIFRNKWVSTQMDETRGVIFDMFKSSLLGQNKLLVNTFPSCIRPHVFNENSKKIYSFIEDNFVATRFDYYLDSNEETYNILVIGPTGAGKSHIINVMFNQEICQSEVSHHGVTREIYFIRGRGNVYNLKEKKFKEQDVLVADTIGLCDPEWKDNNAIIELIKGRIKGNFKYVDAVYIVFRADRLLKEYIES